MNSMPKPLNACLLAEEWPEHDRAGWKLITQPQRSPFRKNGRPATENAFSIRKIRSGYGRWIGFLTNFFPDCLSEPPAERLTLDRLEGYWMHLIDSGNADLTVVDRFNELRMAMQWMNPGRKFTFITSPNGVSLRSRLPMLRKEKLVPLTPELLQWAQHLLQQGIQSHKARVRTAQVREAAMFAILTTHAPRLRALASLRLGTHLYRQGDEWMLDQHANLTKTDKALSMPLSPEVAVIVERYLEVERQELLKGAEHDALWISWDGTPLAEGTISRRTRLRSERQFGEPFGPHRFRASLVTTEAYDGHGTPDASTILGHRGPEVTLASYNYANGSMASRRHADRLKRLRS